MDVRFQGRHSRQHRFVVMAAGGGALLGGGRRGLGDLGREVVDLLLEVVDGFGQGLDAALDVGDVGGVVGGDAAGAVGFVEVCGRAGLALAGGGLEECGLEN